MNLQRRVRARLTMILLVLGSVVAFGTAGYTLIEGWHPFDALYMTVITVASVGFGEIHPLSVAGRSFTIVLIVVGLGAAAYGLSTITAFWIEGDLSHFWERRKMDQRIGALRDHVIVCGGGDTGRHIARELLQTQVPFVVVEADEAQVAAFEKMGRELLYIIGDATDPEVLNTARLATARGLVACMPSDKDNLFTVLTAREVSASVRIVSSVAAEASRPKLLKAGADAVVSSRAIGALRLASEMLRPQVWVSSTPCSRSPAPSACRSSRSATRWPGSPWPPSSFRSGSASSCSRSATAPPGATSSIRCPIARSSPATCSSPADAGQLEAARKIAREG